MATIEEVIKDPDFAQLPFDERIKVFDSIDKDFSGLSLGEKRKVMVRLIPPNPDTEQQFTEERQRSATEDPTFKKAASSLLPAIANVAGAFVPGGPIVSTLAQGALSGSATAINQAVGLEPKSETGVAISAALPIAGQGVVRSLKGIGVGAGKLFGPAAAKESGVEGVAQTAGQNPTSIGRIYNPRASKTAYDVANTVGPVPTAELNEAVGGAVAELQVLSNKPHAVLKYLDNMSKRFSQSSELSYADVTKELQLMGKQARTAYAHGNHVTGSALNEAQEQILSVLDRVSPALRQANAIYRREQSTQAIINVVRSGNSGEKIRKLFENNKLVAGTFKPEEAQEMFRIADDISNMATSSVGITNRLFNAIATPIGQAIASPVGRYMIRQMMLPTGKMSPAGLSAVAQFMRAYSAQEASAQE